LEFSLGEGPDPGSHGSLHPGHDGVAVLRWSSNLFTDVTSRPRRALPTPTTNVDDAIRLPPVIKAAERGVACR
jgi:hypothetical protein